MIATNPLKIQQPMWKQALSDVITSVAELLELLALDPSQLSAMHVAQKDFPLRVPRGFVDRMEVGNPNDPLLLQVLPTADELDAYPGYTTDPLQELSQAPAPGLLHKYHGRVLLLMSGACAINCRYCFRRHFPYSEHVPSALENKKTLTYIQSHQDIEEVILSGGEPLLLNDQALSQFIDELEGISHVKRLRFHTRMPIVIPERITNQLLQRLSQSRLQVIMVMHCNHANEVDKKVTSAMRDCSENNIILLNQSVLLKNINNTVAAQVALSKKLFSVGILPYYLHVLDKVNGAGHFEVAENEAKVLLVSMKKALSGYLVPKLVREVPGVPYKQAI